MDFNNIFQSIRLDHDQPLLILTFHRVRVAIHWFVTKPFFDGFIMFVILLSSAALAAEDPVQEYHPRNVLLKYFDYGFTAIFAVECTLKVSPCFYSNRLFPPSAQSWPA